MDVTSRRHRLWGPKGKRGLTLVELLIVIVLVAIAAALAVPLLADTEATRLRAAARLLVADLAFAQIESITHADDPCVVIFDSVSHAYSIAKASDPATPMTEPVTNQPYTVQFGTGRAAESTGVTIQSYSLDGDDRVTFGLYGELDQTTPATITLQAGALTMTVQIDPASGEATLQ